MIIRTATCRCGQLQARCHGDPVRISVCHCLDCQKRSGSVFAIQARWLEALVEITGAFSEWSQAGDSGEITTFRFCGICGATLAYRSAAFPGVIAIAVGGFADPNFPPPRFSVYEGRKHSWVAVTADDIARLN